MNVFPVLAMILLQKLKLSLLSDNLHIIFARIDYRANSCWNKPRHQHQLTSSILCACPCTLLMLAASYFATIRCNVYLSVPTPEVWTHVAQEIKGVRIARDTKKGSNWPIEFKGLILFDELKKMHLIATKKIKAQLGQQFPNWLKHC